MQNLFNNKYPYTDFHELNLDYLLNTYQAIVDEVNEINTWIAQHKIEYEEAIERLTRVENEIDTFEAQINKAFERLKEDQQRQLDEAIAQINLEVDEKLADLSAQVQQAIDEINSKFERMQIEVRTEINAFKTLVNNEIIAIRNEMRANNQIVFTWVENRIQELINELPEILTINVYNPYRGYVTNIQIAVNDLYSLASIWGLTASQYDNLGLTASEYDNLELTAMEYDTTGYKLLYPDPNYYMISPFNGQMVRVQDVVNQLAQFHKESLTAQGYDEKELTAQGYDDLELTAYEYDWYGASLIA